MGHALSGKLARSGWHEGMESALLGQLSAGLRVRGIGAVGQRRLRVQLGGGVPLLATISDAVHSELDPEVYDART